MIVMPLIVAALSIAGAVAILTAPGGPPADLPPGERPPIGLTVGVIALLAAGCDLRMMLKGGLSGAARIAPHIDRVVPLSEGAKMTERLRRPNYGTLEVELTIDDPKTYTRPWTVKMTQAIQLDTELIDEICAENEKSWQRMQPGEVPRSQGGRAN